eukprot:615421-Prorocentrum_minimum.AAC.1
MEVDEAVPQAWVELDFSVAPEVETDVKYHYGWTVDGLGGSTRDHKRRQTPQATAAILFPTYSVQNTLVISRLVKTETHLRHQLYKSSPAETLEKL